MQAIYGLTGCKGFPREVRIYNAPKTVIDCFRWRNTVGLDVALEAARDPIIRPRQRSGFR
jgi:hypothetical protein